MAERYKTPIELLPAFLINLILIMICVVWLVPIVGVLITSFRHSEDIFTSGWWTVFPHKADVQVGEIKLEPSVNVDGPITIEGTTATFEEWRQGVTLADGRTITWYGNKRTRTLTISEKKWVGFSTSMTIKN